MSVNEDIFANTDDFYKVFLLVQAWKHSSHAFQTCRIVKYSKYTKNGWLRSPKNTYIRNPKFEKRGKKAKIRLSRFPGFNRENAFFSIFEVSAFSALFRTFHFREWVSRTFDFSQKSRKKRVFCMFFNIFKGF